MKKLKGKALKRALQVKDAHRIYDDVPIIQDTTEYIDPQKAHDLLDKNKCNRPVHWPTVEKFALEMEKGNWEFHAQGIIIDDKGYLLTGQKRLWAIIYSGKPQYMRISRGSPSKTADFIDRGQSQTSRDLAARKTERRHSPTEASIARCICAARSNTKPSLDDIAAVMVEYEKSFTTALEATKGVKKRKPIMMIMAAICFVQKAGVIPEFFAEVEEMTAAFEASFKTVSAEKCWNKGAAYAMAMEKACEVVKDRLSRSRKSGPHPDTI